MSDALLPFKRYFQFSGRARRREYWMYVLLVIVLGIAFGLLDAALGLGGSFSSNATQSASEGYSASISVNGGVLSIAWMLLTLIPSLAVLVRRLHDTDRSAWWMLILLVPLLGAIVLLVFLCLDGTPGANRFGPSPKTAERLAFA